MRTAGVVVLLVAALGVVLAAQELPTRLGGTNGPRPAAPAPARAVPRLPDGTIDFNGVWSGGGPVGDVGVQGGLKPGYLESIMTPWAKALLATRNDSQDPYQYCMPAGVPRMAADFAWRLVQYPTIKPTHIFLLYEGNMHSFRQIFMDGRKHPPDPDPDLVRPLDRLVGKRHARGRYDRLQRQVLVRPKGHAAHRAAPHD